MALFTTTTSCSSFSFFAASGTPVTSGTVTLARIPMMATATRISTSENPRVSPEAVLIKVISFPRKT